MLLKNASLMFLRDGRHRLSSQALLPGCSENVPPLIRKLCSAPATEKPALDGGRPYQVVALAHHPPHDTSGRDTALSNVDVTIEALRKALDKKMGPKKLHGAEAEVSPPQGAYHPHHDTSVRDTAPGNVDAAIEALRKALEKKKEPKRLHEAHHPPHDNSRRDSAPSNGDAAIRAPRKAFEKQKPMKLLGTRAKFSSPPRVDRLRQNKLPGRTFRPNIFQVVLHPSSNPLGAALDKWVKDGNRLGKHEFAQVRGLLKKQLRYGRLLQFMDWVERRERPYFNDRDYTLHLDLIARNRGIEAAQKYIERVPILFRNQVFYETMLANCVRLNDLKSAEEVFEKIRNMSLPLTVYACDLMTLLYKRVACDKAADIIMFMEKECIKPSPYTYKLLIHLKGQSNHISGVDSVLETMKENGVYPDFATQTIVAKLYISKGLKERAEEVIRGMEVYVPVKQHAIRSLLSLYAALGKPDDVERLWRSCTEPELKDFLAAIKAWGKLGRVEQAEETFEALLKTSLQLTPNPFDVMRTVYADNKLLSRGEEFLKRMGSVGCPNGPLIWDALVSLYVNSGEVKKADSFLLNLTEENPDRRPLLGSYIKLLKAYAEQGDVDNAEKIFDRLTKIRYPEKTPPYDVLHEAYVNAKVPPHGLREKMRADSAHLSKSGRKLLKLLDNLQEEDGPKPTE